MAVAGNDLELQMSRLVDNNKDLHTAYYLSDTILSILHKLIYLILTLGL